MNQVKLKYQEFLMECIENLKNQLGEEYNIQLNTILKNNSITMDGVVILKDGAKITPNIYLEEYYLLYEQGKSMEEIVSELIHVYFDKVRERSDVDIQFTYEAMKSQIIYRLVNSEKNRELLAECPHIEFLDLAVTFHCLVQDEMDSIGTIRITNEHLKLWQITTAELYEQAKENTPKLMPPVLRKMEEVLREILNEENLPMNEEQIQIELQRLEEDSQVPEHERADMYILSNTKGINGASCLLYSDIIRNFSRLLQCDIYILPSSIHEIILLPAVDAYRKEQLEEMVSEINQTQVPYEEVLSDHVYYYSFLDNQMKVL